MSGYYEGLAERARSGDRHAWERLWEHLRPQIYSKLRPLLNDVPGMEAEDVLGWTMGETWRLVRLHDPSRSKVSTFVLNGLRGRLQNLRRDALARGRGAFYLAARPTDDHDPTDVPDERSLYEHHRAETWADIEATLQALPETDMRLSLVNAVRHNPDATLAEVSRIANLRSDETHRFLRGLGELSAPKHRGQRAGRALPKITML